MSGGTDNHLMLVDVTPLGVTGKEAETLLDEVGITVNKNAIPFDPLPPNTASGIRVGTPATTTRGFGPDEMRAIGGLIVDAIARRDDPPAQRPPARPRSARSSPGSRSRACAERRRVTLRARRVGRPLPFDPRRLRRRGARRLAR